METLELVSFSMDVPLNDGTYAEGISGTIPFGVEPVESGIVEEMTVLVLVLSPFTAAIPTPMPIVGFFEGLW